MRYVLYSGAGNTFALTEKPLSSEEARLLCEATDVDGVIFPENTFRMRTFNRDGSEAEMCGNGLRCFIKFLIELGVEQGRYTIDTLAGTHTAWVKGDQICVKLPPPRDIRWDLKIESYTLHHLNTGVPHAVLFVDDVEAVNLMELGAKIRHNSLFPEGTNVNFVESDTLRMRTYERGVERETLACGTGATASALTAAHVLSRPTPVIMEMQSEAKLKISFTSDWQEVVMEGPAERVGEGIFCGLLAKV